MAAAPAEGPPGCPYAKLFDMRRALPWVTVGLLIVGVGAGVGLGVAGQTPAPVPPTATRQIAGIVAATRRAGTVRFSYSDSSASPNPLLRQSDRGSGEIDFGNDTMSTLERDRSTGLSGTSTTTTKEVAQDVVMNQVWIGRTEYTRFRPETSPGLDTPWLKGATWPKDSFGPLGALGQIGPLGELALDESVPGFRVEDAGSDMVDGTEATRYRILVPLCGASAPQDGITESMAPLELWVDGGDRLVRARMSTTEDITKEAHLGDLAAGQGLLTGRVTTVSTIDLGHFGAPAAIAAPRVVNAHASQSFGFATSTSGHCR